MICKVCGKEIKDGSKFCPFCGSNLIQKEAISEVTKENTIDDTSNSSAQNQKTQSFTYELLTAKLKEKNPTVLIACGAIFLLGLAVCLSVINSNKSNNTITNGILSGQESNEDMKVEVYHYDTYYDATVIESVSADTQQGNSIDINNIKNFKYGMDSSNLDNQKGIRIYCRNGVTYQDGEEIKIKDGFMGLLQINEDMIIRLRTSPSTSGTVIGHLYEFCILGYYKTTTENGFTWYKIDKDQDYWMADNGEWITLADY